MSEQVQPETHDPSEPPQDSEEMSLEVLEERIREADELHRELSRRLDQTARD